MLRPPLLKPQKVHKRPKPLRASNPKRKADRYEKNFSGEGATDHGDFIRDLSCAVFNCNGMPIEAAHTIARGAGGCGSSWRKLIPLCRRHHTGPQGQEGRSEEFGTEHGLDLGAIAEVMVVADPGVLLVEQVAAWERLLAYPEAARLGALQRGLDLTGHTVEPPSVSVDLAGGQQ